MLPSLRWFNITHWAGTIVRENEFRIPYLLELLVPTESGHYCWKLRRDPWGDVTAEFSSLLNIRPPWKSLVDKYLVAKEKYHLENGEGVYFIDGSVMGNEKLWG